MGEGLCFWNLYTETVYVAISWFKFMGTFPNGEFMKIGWYALAPGGAPTVVVDQDLRSGVNEYFSWFACVGLDGPWWSGDLTLDVSYGVFDQAYNDDFERMHCASAVHRERRTGTKLVRAHYHAASTGCQWATEPGMCLGDSHIYGLAASWRTQYSDYRKWKRCPGVPESWVIASLVSRSREPLKRISSNRHPDSKTNGNPTQPIFVGCARFRLRAH